MHTLLWLNRAARPAVLLGMLLLALLAAPAPVPAAARSTRPTTPELIDRAYARGAITGDQRLTYLIEAVRDPGGLPAWLLGRGGWSATMVLREINQARQALAGGRAAFSPALRAALAAPTPQAATVCDTEDGANTLNTTHFHIVYDSINTLTAQQYASALEETFSTEIGTYGWAQPPLSDNNPFGRFPVQIAPIGNQTYGYVTSPGGSYTGTVGDNPNTAATETAALASCMVVNSNMLQFANGNAQAALLALRVTMAHEYFHAVQFGTGDPGNAEDTVWLESTAAYVEDEVLPEAHDNYQYLYPNLTVSLPSHDGNDAQYSMWPLFRYAAERNGGLQSASGTSLMKAMWAAIAAGQPAITAYDSALRSRGANLDDTFHRFAASLRFMKPCATSTPFCFSDGGEIVSNKGGTPGNQGDIGSVGGGYTGSLPNTYAANWIGLPGAGTYAVQVDNTSGSGTLHASIVADLGDAVAVTGLAGTAGAGQSLTIGSYTVPDGAAGVVLVLTNEQVSLDVANIAVSSYQVSTGTAAELDQFTFLPWAAK